MEHEHVGALIAMSLFALGAVVVILYQHANATQQILGAIGASPAGQGSSQAGFLSGLGMPVSLAGTPTIGQSGASLTPAVVPLNTNPGYTLQ